MSEQEVVNVEEIVEEVVEEQEVEQSTEEVAEPEKTIDNTQEAPNLEMDFTGIVPEEAPVAEPEPDYDSVIESVVEKVLAKQNVKAEEERDDDDDDDTTYLSKKDLAEYTKKVEQDVLTKINQQQQAQQTIQQNFQRSGEIVNNYAKTFSEKLDQNGFNLDANPSLKNTADMLSNQLKLQYATQVGRPITNPLTGQIDPILTPQETGEIVKQHWEIFSKNYLPTTPSGQKANTTPLGAGNTATPAEPNYDADEDMKAFMEKKANGTVTTSDAIAMLLKSGQKK